MSLDPDIERVNPYSNLNPRVTAPEGRQDRRQRRRREDHQAEEPEDVLDLHGDEEEAEAGDSDMHEDDPNRGQLDLSA